MHASQPAAGGGAGGVELPAPARAALRAALAAVILKTQAEAAAQTAQWRERARAAEAEARALREGLLADLALERPAPDLPAAVRAVAAVCRPLPSAADDAGDADAEAQHAAFLRQARIVQAVRESAAGSRAAPPTLLGAPARASQQDVAAFVVELLTAMGSDEPPKHAQAFADAAFRYLGAGSDGAASLEEACGALCDAVLTWRSDGAAPDCRACVRAALCRLARTGVSGARAALLAAAARLRDASERCADVAKAGGAPAAPSAPDTPDSGAEEEAQRAYDNVYYLVRVVEAALAALAAPRRGAGASAEDAAATAAMEAFARVHARAQRCAEPLRPRFGLLSVAVRRVTAAANLCALELLARPQADE